MFFFFLRVATDHKMVFTALIRHLSVSVTEPDGSEPDGSEPDGYGSFTLYIQCWEQGSQSLQGTDNGVNE